MIKKFSAALLSTIITLSALPTAFANGEQKPTYPVVTVHSTSLKAFSDIENNAAKADIEYLLDRNMIKGYDHSMFRPEAYMTNAEAITLLTEAFQLSLLDGDSNKATSKMTNNKEEAWYSKAFAIATDHKVSMSKHIEPNGVVTREQFASWIIEQLDRINVYPVIRMYIHIADHEQIATEYSGAVQTLLLTRIANLSEDQNFRPKDAITRGEAADWIADAVKFADKIREKKEVNYKDSVLTEEQFAKLLKQALKVDDAIPLTAEDEVAKPVTREQAATLIVNDLDKKGNYPVKMMFIHIDDEAEITSEISYKVHTLLLTDIAQLDEDGKFRPQDAITEKEAQEWLENAAQFAKFFEI